jgi:hypothetical protein
MKVYINLVLSALAGAGLAGPAIAQVPSTNDTSDEYFNTGSGTNALFSVTPTTVGCGESGTCNTALSANERTYLAKTHCQTARTA